MLNPYVRHLWHEVNDEDVDCPELRTVWVSDLVGALTYIELLEERYFKTMEEDYEYSIKATHETEPERTNTFPNWVSLELAQEFLELAKELDMPDVVFEIVRRRVAGTEEVYSG